MKVCGYCGRQNEEPVLQCSECGTAFTTDASWTLADVAEWRPKSASGLALATGLGALLIATGVYLAAGRACLDIGGPPSAAPPRFYSYIIRMPPVLDAFLSIGATVLIFVVCNVRCRTKWQGIATALVALSLAAFLKCVPGTSWSVMPAVFLLAITHSSVGFYIGATLQLAIGAWLLGWLRGRVQ
jgi:hypothetical protein